MMEEHRALAERAAELEGRVGRAEVLDARRRALVEELRAAQLRVGAARRKAAPALAKAVQARLADLALAKARIAVEIPPADSDPAGEEVTVLLAANPGSPLLPLAKVASGGELARAMLALRLVLSKAGYTSPPTQIFD
ncbi:MAG: hypothetical protein IT196_01645 [Acidimicrobiales bacterium]|nr:hypothetical protein [Acidimicrobiales bacterium]